MVNSVFRLLCHSTRWFTDTSTLPADEDNESVGSSQDGSVVSEEGIEKHDTEEQLAFQLGEAVEQLADKRYMKYTSHLCFLHVVILLLFCCVIDVHSVQARLTALSRLNKLCSENVLVPHLAGRYESL